MRIARFDRLSVAMGSLLICAHVAAGQAATFAEPGRVDEAAFREGLRQWGLDEWLEQYLQETPPVDEADARLRHREELLSQAYGVGISRAQRRGFINAASEILTGLIEVYPTHPDSYRWRSELVRDALERNGVEMCDAVLLYELPGRDRRAVHEAGRWAVDRLAALQTDIATAWASLESLDELQLLEATETGSLQWLESVDQSCAMMLAWARLYRTLTGDAHEPGRAEALSELVQDVTQRYGWTQLPASRVIQRCSALAIAMVAARESRQFAAADGHARAAIAAIQQVTDPAVRRSVDKLALLAVLEQIRVLRDRGRLDEALDAARQAQAWADRSHPEEMQFALSLALAERSILVRAKGLSLGSDVTAASAPAGLGSVGGGVFVAAGLLDPPEALMPLERVAARSPAWRDTLYGVLAGAIEGESPRGPRSPFAFQLLMGAALADVPVNEVELTPALVMRLEESVNAGQAAFSRLPVDAPADLRGEFLFLLGSASKLVGRRLDALDALGRLAQSYPEHDRSTEAERSALGIVQTLLEDAEAKDTSSAREAFIEAGRLLSERFSEGGHARRLRYHVALALERNGRLKEAAEVYPAVESDDPHAVQAAVGCARCLSDMLRAAGTTGAQDGVQIARLAQETLLAARRAEALASGRARENPEAVDPCIPAQLALLIARVGSYLPGETAPSVLADVDAYESLARACPSARAGLLGERTELLRKLGRHAEARTSAEALLQVDPESAGPVMAAVLASLREGMLAAADRGDADSTRRMAMEAEQLAGRLAAWASERRERVPARDAAAIQVWRAQALLAAGRAAEALQAYESCGATATAPAEDGGVRVEIQLGRAECLLALDRADEAMPVFDEVWARTAERSPEWWRALVGSLTCHTRLGSDPAQILESIRQQRNLAPELGGGRWRLALEAIEKANQSHLAAGSGG